MNPTGLTEGRDPPPPSPLWGRAGARGVMRPPRDAGRGKEKTRNLKTKTGGRPAFLNVAETTERQKCRGEISGRSGRHYPHAPTCRTRLLLCGPGYVVPCDLTALRCGGPARLPRTGFAVRIVVSGAACRGNTARIPGHSGPVSGRISAKGGGRGPRKRNQAAQFLRVCVGSGPIFAELETTQRDLRFAGAGHPGAGCVNECAREHMKQKPARLPSRARCG
jgi:hypothetical protein